MSGKSLFGEVPGDWSIRRLGELTTKIGSGATPTGGEKAYLPKRHRFTLIRSQCVHDRRFDVASVSFITDEQARRLGNASVQRGDILLNITGDGVTFSRSAQVPAAVLPAYVNQHVSIIRADPALLLPGYLLAFLTHPDTKPYIEAFSSGGSRRAITKGHIQSFELPLPPLDEQIRIVEVLGSLDDKIELNRRMNETLEAMAQAIFRDWFVDFGPTRRKMDGASDPIAVLGGLVTDPDRARELTGLFPARLGDDGLPERWEEKPLLEQATWVNGAAYKNMHFSSEPDALPVIKIAELKTGVTPTTKWTNSDLGDKYRIGDGELLFSWSGNPDTSIDAFVWTGGQAWLNQHIFAVRNNGTRSLSSLFIILRYLKPQFAEIARNKQTTGLGHVTKEDMRRLLICAPTPDVRDAFDELTQPLVDLLLNKLFESKALAATRDLLLPKLMSGEIRLRDVEGELEAAQ